jgi:hypothetical protein
MWLPQGVPYRAESHPEDLERELAEERARTKRGFYAHAGVYVVVMALLAAINLSQSPHRFWFVFPLAAWGIWVLGHGVAAFALGPGGWLEQLMINREINRELRRGLRRGQSYRPSGRACSVPGNG